MMNDKHMMTASAACSSILLLTGALISASAVGVSVVGVENGNQSRR